LAIENSGDPRKAKTRFNNATWGAARKAIVPPIRKQHFENYLQDERGLFIKRRFGEVVRAAGDIRSQYENEDLRRNYLVRKRIVETKLPKFLRESVKPRAKGPALHAEETEQATAKLLEAASQSMPKRQDASDRILDAKEVADIFNFAIFESPRFEQRMHEISVRNAIDRENYDRHKNLVHSTDFAVRAGRMLSGPQASIERWKLYGTDLSPEVYLPREVRFEGQPRFREVPEDARRRRKNGRC